MMRATSVQETIQQRVKLQFTKMRNPLAAEHPANDEVEQDTMNRENRVVRFVAGEAAQCLGVDILPAAITIFFGKQTSVMVSIMITGTKLCLFKLPPVCDMVGGIVNYLSHEGNVKNGTDV
jgi:hypothetical protein